ncbi:MAG: twin-arginine translocation signal domain-containing protein [Anaerolineales bacterium]
MRPERTLSRRDFLTLSTIGVGASILHPLRSLIRSDDFPQSERLGRVIPGKVEFKSRPDASNPTNGILYQDAVLPWLRETVSSRPFRTNQRWIEPPEGYLWSPEVQPVENQPNSPVEHLPQTSLGPGMWAEVSVPYVNLILANPPARAPWLKNRLDTGLPPRFYFSQIAWVDQIRQDDNGQI